MAQMILTEIIPLTYGVGPGKFYVQRGTEGANLSTEDPREVWVDTGADGVYAIYIDFGADVEWDTISLINLTASSAATWIIQGGATYGGTNYLNETPVRMPSDDGVSASGPALFWSPVVKVGRYLAIYVDPKGAPINTLGRVVVGKSWKPSMPREFGAGRPPVDTGSRTRLDNGGLSTVAGHLLSGFKWVFADLEPADIKRLWGMYRRLRTTEPFLLIEDPEEGTAEGHHYCTFVDLEAYERNDASKSRMVMTVEDWV